MSATTTPPLLPETAQRQASDPAVSAWVSASAGTGKTKVLTDRVLRLMLAGTAPDKILCITFTKAAAAEMALRIGRTLRGWATMSDGDLAAGLAGLTGSAPDRHQQAAARRLFAQVLDAQGGMKIQTIHALCQSLLRRFPLEAGLPPHFELMDERTAAELLDAARHAILQTPRPGVAEALAKIAGRVSAEAFADLMAELARERGRLARLIGDHSGVDGLVAATGLALGLGAGETEVAAVAAACQDEAFDGPALRRAAAILLDGSKTDAERGGAVFDWLAADAEGRAAGLDRYAAAYLTQKGEPRKTLITKKQADAFPDAAAALAVEADRLVALAERRRALVMAAATAALVIVGAAIVDAYAAEKARRALLDYDDLILRSADLLERPGVAPWVLFKLDGGIDHVLIDEAQDTNPDQWRVAAAISAEFFVGAGARDGARTVFVVGDEKQSIFSFQRADPAEFARMREAFRERIEAAQKALRPVALSVSFRSTQAVLDVVDAVFAGAAARDGVVAEGEPPIHHRAHRIGQGGLVELWPPIGPEAAPDGEIWSPPVEQGAGGDPGARLAARIAGTTAGWITRGELLEARGRPIHAGDVLILVRTRNAFFVELVRALKAQGIDVAGVDRMVLTHQLAAMDLIALAQFLLLPEDDLTLATVLRGPLIGLSEEALFDLANGRGGSLWGALRDAVDGRPELAASRDYLAGLLARVDFLPPYELFSRVLETACPADAGSGRRAILGRLGEEALDPLDELLGLALAFETGQPASLQRFLHWLAAGEAEVKREMDQGAPSRVRIMTVHGAKGLQAPIVILPDTLSTPTKGPAILWPDEDGPSVPLWPPRRADEDPTARAARERANRRRDREFRRLLYVALTRAEDRLYICGYHGRNGPSAGCWHELCSAALAEMPGVEPVQLDGFDAPAVRYRLPQTAAVELIEAPAPPAMPGLPPWAGRPAAPEPRPPRPLAPSRPADEPPVLAPLVEDGRRFRRGRIIHALLQTLPDVAPAQRRAAAARYLARPGHGLPPEARAAIADEIMAVLGVPDFAALFGAGSLAEVPLVGRVGERVVSGQIDRLVVRDDSVLVVDYKSNRPPPERPDSVPPAYLSQMAAYRALLRRIYPDRPVCCALLWTDGPRLMRLEDGLLDGWAP